ncbi:AMP-binding protein [Janibacter anophelis]|uniref:AMP-binding protein n=1 Tax=Janibacter anophelis TaxID=319054 RepID=UPI003F7ED68F
MSSIPSMDLQGRVVMIREQDPEAVIGTLLLCWAVGAVPILAASDLAGAPWWKLGEGSFVAGETHEWGVPDGCALLQATSGSTGLPKLAMRSVESLLWERLAYNQVFEGVDGPLSHCIRLEHSLGLGITVASLLAGREVIHAAPWRAERLVRAGQGGVVAGTPSTLRIVMGVWPVSGKAPQAVFCGAGQVDADLRAQLQRFWPRTPLRLGFGSTETGGVLGGAGPGLGRALAGATAVGLELGQTGQLRLRLPHIVMGSLGECADEQRDPYEWTFPDLVRMSDEGAFEHIARITQTLRRREKVEPVAQLAELLSTHGRAWSIVEQADTSARTLVVEGRALSGPRARSLENAVKDVDPSMRILFHLELPRNELGKIRWHDLEKIVKGVSI